MSLLLDLLLRLLHILDRGLSIKPTKEQIASANENISVTQYSALDCCAHHMHIRFTQGKGVDVVALQVRQAVCWRCQPWVGHKRPCAYDLQIDAMFRPSERRK